MQEVEADSDSDEAVIRRVVAGDPNAVRWLLIDHCGPRLKYLVSVRYSSLGLELSELISELYLQLSRNDWIALRNFQGSNQNGQSCSLRSYITLIASRLLCKKNANFVKESRRMQPLDTLEDCEKRVSHDPFPHAMTEVFQIIQQLDNPIDRALLLLYKVEGLPVEEVARRLQLSVGSVYTRCSRALDRLGELAKEDGVHD